MRKFYLTTSIAYVNAPPHLGFALELVQADLVARYHRLLGEDVFFLTGTDEHGAKIAKAASQENSNPKEFVDKISAKFQSLKKALNLSNDDFIRTTDKKRHFPAVKKVWLKLKAKGDIYKKKYKGLYCSGCEAFITRKDLKDGKCLIHQKEPEIIEEENYFFRLSKYSKEIERIISQDIIKIIPQARKKELLNFIKQGLEDISFSRPRKDLKWAIPVPGDPKSSIYVWADALTNYISAIGYAKNSKKFRKFWPADVHFIGKDILKFHGAIWPGMLLSLGLPLPKIIFVHGFITVSGQKMSKSLGNVIDPFELVEKYGTDAVRYFLLREIPATKDGDFTKKKFIERYNSDLANGLGNFTSRILSLARRFEEEEIQGNRLNNFFDSLLKKTWKSYRKSLDSFNFNEALNLIWELISFCNKYIDKVKPWEKRLNKRNVTVGNLLNVLANIAFLLSPFLPSTAKKIFYQLGINEKSKKAWRFKIKKPEILFPRINSS
jgi:methionyl-tRNA synthetase